jgi:hypothetical protein
MYVQTYMLRFHPIRSEAGRLPTSPGAPCVQLCSISRNLSRLRRPGRKKLSATRASFRTSRVKHRDIMQNPQNFRNTSSLLDRLGLHVGYDNINGISKPVQRGMTGCATKDKSIFLVLSDAQSKSAQNVDLTRTVK